MWKNGTGGHGFLRSRPPIFTLYQFQLPTMTFRLPEEGPLTHRDLDLRGLALS